MRRLIIRVSGKVQGVFYRASAKNEADRLGVLGVVRNEPNGGVYIEAEGDEPELSSFVAWCKKGPPRSHILTFVMEDAPLIGYVGFRIIR